jgi:hypothetical protein
VLFAQAEGVEPVDGQWSKVDKAVMMLPMSTVATPVPVASPAAVRAGGVRWRDPRLAVGLAVIALCTLLGARALAAADDTVAVWAAGHTLSAGERVGAEDLVRVDVRFGSQSAADRYLSANGGLPDGAVVDRAVDEGELLARSAVAGAGAAALTEVPLSVETGAVPDTLRVGATVDVYVTLRDSTAAQLVLDDVAVVAAPVSGTSLGPTATRQVIVGVRQDQAARLPRSLAALAGGAVTLTSTR